MTRQIKRNNWSRFCRRFSSNNLLRTAKIVVEGDNAKDIPTEECFPLLGIALKKKGRFIDGLEIVAGNADAETAARPVAVIKDPAEVILEQSGTGQDSRLELHSRDGTVAVVELRDAIAENAYSQLVSRMAYSLYEKRGRGHGRDWSDWFEADRRLKQTIEQFV